MKPQSVAIPEYFKSQIAVAIYLLVGFFCAVIIRIALGQPDVSHSGLAGLVFAAFLVLLSISSGVNTTVNKHVIITGILGGLFLCLPALFFQLKYLGAHTPDGNYFVWSIIVATVAFAEEAFLRGALYDKITAASNQKIAILVAACAFAILHLPLYGWHAVPMDFAVGLWLGSLRYSTGTFLAPGIAHVLADLAAWWI